MNEHTSKIALRILNIIILVLILIVMLNIKTCSDNITVTNYDGFKHECEKLGGIVNGGLCWDASVLINMEGNVKPLIHADLTNTTKENN